MRIFAFLIFGALLASPGWGEPTPPPIPSGMQLDQLQGVLSRYADRLLALNRQRQLLTRMRGLVTPEQQAVLRQLRITPEQSVALLELLQETLPQVALQREDPTRLRDRLLPRVVQIIGPEQADLILQLAPTPQQTAQLQDLLRESSQLWQQAIPKHEELMTDVLPLLRTDQARWLEMFQSLFRKPRD